MGCHPLGPVQRRRFEWPFPGCEQELRNEKVPQYQPILPRFRVRIKFPCSGVEVTTLCQL